MDFNEAWNQLLEIQRSLANLQSKQLLSMAKQEGAAPPHEREFMTVRQAADYMAVSPATVRNLMYAGKIKRCQPCGKIVFYAADLKEFMLSTRTETAMEKEAEYQRQADEI